MAELSRKLDSWVDAFCEYTDDLPSPPLFRKWSAISCIAGALERKVWVRSMNMDLYPNMYIVLVGPPGVGKTVVSSQTEDMWRSLQSHWVAPKSVSKASLIDSLQDAKRDIARAGEANVVFHSLLIHAGELGVLLPSYENDFMNVLTDIYDGRVYEERRRSKELHIKLMHPQLNILAATTPSYLSNVLPEGAWDQGFLSRTMLIYSGEKQLREVIGDDAPDRSALLTNLRTDLRAIGRMFGKIGLTSEAVGLLNRWHMAGGPPTPDHPKLTNYLTRRTAHLIKLCQVATVSRGNDYTITAEDFRVALDWMVEAETAIPDAFLAMQQKGSTDVINEAWYFLFQKFKAEKKPVSEHRLVAFVSAKVPSNEVLRVIEIMERSGKIQKSITATGAPAWKPLQLEY